ncbi:MAG: bifunctional tetrahydrofolate synthase/dihydrofolate synthase [Burkholderiales bacterium]|nr:bifunctional tetrahydrofolate synthase/dihydrofolate synthase [Burkholderiales bacterium]
MNDSDVDSLARWLERIESLRSGPSIALGLDRIRPIFARMGLAPTCPVVLVGGTNGKGSVCAYLDAILRAGGYRIGRYTSPHLHRFQERVAIGGRAVDDAALVAAFDAVEAARDGVALTFFEYTTLAAFHVFRTADLDAWVVEVGLGGRLDATNVLDADCAVIVSIGVDHTDWLGPTRELIAIEKAGIVRRGQPVIVADPDPPASLGHAIGGHGGHAYLIGREFGWHRVGEVPLQWGFWMHDAAAGADARYHRHGLPLPALRGNVQLGNAAAALAALHCLRERLPVAQAAVKEGLLNVEWPGRFQVLPGRPVVVLDVAHNPHAARALAATLADMKFIRTTHAVFSMFADKDIDGVVDAVRAQIGHWHVAPLPGPRATPLAHLVKRLLAHGVAVDAIHPHDSIAEAFAAAQKSAAEADRIVIFGSFLTVAEATEAGE